MMQKYNSVIAVLLTLIGISFHTSKCVMGRFTLFLLQKAMVIITYIHTYCKN
jgi:UDP-N-acetylmuramyl tripeptide synthase